MADKSLGPLPTPAAGIDFDRANAARIYDHLLGGAHNFAVDRQAAERVLAGHPDAVHAARSQRNFMGRAVRWCCEQGIDQFLDLGSGIPTVGNVHEIAQRENPEARVAYVDFEPVAVAHSTEILAEVPGTSITAADVRDPASVLAAPGVAGLLDFDRPVAVVAVGLLHFVDDTVVDAMIEGYLDALVPGSALVVSHSSDDHDDPALARHVRDGAEAYRGTATEATLRSRARIRAVLGRVDVVDPGLVDVTAWPATTDDAAPTGVLAAVGRVVP